MVVIVIIQLLAHVANIYVIFQQIDCWDSSLTNAIYGGCFLIHSSCRFILSITHPLAREHLIVSRLEYRIAQLKIVSTVLNAVVSRNIFVVSHDLTWTTSTQVPLLNQQLLIQPLLSLASCILKPQESLFFISKRPYLPIKHLCIRADSSWLEGQQLITTLLLLPLLLLLNVLC